MDIIVKNEFPADYTAISFCHACLSTDRVLSTANEYVDIYYKICDNQNMQLPIETHLCWECAALLKRLRMFTKKVAEAQRILEFYNTNKQDFPNSLSSLTTYKSTDNNEIKLNYEEKEIKPIKQEAEFHEDSDNLDPTDNIKDATELYIGIKETKVDVMVLPETSKSDLKDNMKQTKHLINRKAKYRFLNIKLQKHRRKLVRKIPIKLNEVLIGLEEERGGSFSKEKYKCACCVATWKDKGGLDKHIKMWHDDANGSYQCNICQIRCPYQDQLVAHQTKHFFRRECKVCHAQYCSESIMDQHLEKHHRMVQCLACELCFKNVPLFYTHYKALHSKFLCDVCGKRCRTRAIIEKHLKYHFGYECPHCKKKLKNPTSYKHHVETQHVSSVSDDTYCVQCDKTFMNDRLYKKHLENSAAHARERRTTRYHFGYECPHCKKKLKNPTSYKHHVETQHVSSVSDDTYCVQCDKTFMNDRLYKKHLENSAAHARERRTTRPKRKYDKKYPCPECGNVYTRKTYMNNHYRHVHTKQSKYYCEDCDQHFLNRTKFVDHRRYQHEGAERAKNKHCDICGRGFAFNTTLINHIRTHTGERPFACEHCDAKFAQKYAMLTHVRHIHLKSKRKSS